MKRGGLLFAAFLLISGVLRFAGPGSSAAPAGQEGGAQSKAKKEANKAGTSKAPPIPYLQKFAGTLRDFYGLPANDATNDTDLAGYFAGLQPPPGSGSAQFVIALLPDPVHTRLGLFFDRSAEALQQAAQIQHYAFDRAILPWDRSPHTENEDPKTRQEERAEQARREAYPGLLIFRFGEEGAGSPKESAPEKGPLFVLVVGETPTAGLNRTQFRNALLVLQELRKVTAGSDTSKSGNAIKKRLLILGPSFSGSLESLGQELRADTFNGVADETLIYSGTVTGTTSMLAFQQQLADRPGFYFASFQENDDAARDEFLQFASDRGYKPHEVAVLSEDGTVFGASDGARARTASSASGGSAAATPSGQGASGAAENSSGPSPLDGDVVKLHFPREISYFRSAYQKEAAQAAPVASASGVSILPLNLDETGSDDDTVAPYAVQQTSLSQEAVMIGVVSELQKHHIKFTLLLASDPLDELFLASYLRKAYAQGRVVITAPDLLFAREGDPALSGVLGLNSYALIPGLSDRLCRQNEAIHWHEDRLFVSSLSAGTFNAMAGLLAVEGAERAGWSPLADADPMKNNPAGNAAPSSTTSLSPEELLLRGSIPNAPYAEYGSPNLDDAAGDYCEERPLLWLSILGRDGFWPLAGLNDRNLVSADGQIPVASLDAMGKPPSTLKTAYGTRKSYGLLSTEIAWEQKLSTPPAWNIAYCLCLVLLVVHAAFSWTGSILADSEERAQFARDTDCRAAIVLALGAFALASAFVLIMCTRTPRVEWTGPPGFTALLWLPYPLFVGVTIWDLGKLREELRVACGFAIAVCLMTFFQVFLVWTATGSWRVYWSTRLLHLASGVSPILPVLLLLGAAYWWMWMSLRGVCLVDLRRPRLPDESQLSAYSYRISDTEGEDIRQSAHPLYFSPQVLIPVLALAVIALVALHRDLPVQSVEGKAFDWGFTLILSLMTGALLGCLLKLVRTWQKCHQVLAGLDRLPLRMAFGRMKNLSWHSFWNPGGSTLRETYKVLSRALENLTRLEALAKHADTKLATEVRAKLEKQIGETFARRGRLMATYGKILPLLSAPKDKPLSWWGTVKRWWKDDLRRGGLLRRLVKRVEYLQKGMAETAALLIGEVLTPLWNHDDALVVSTDEGAEKKALPPFRALAEEYVALVYVNFLVSVLLRLRTMVISAAGMYVFIVLSMNTYPFEPHPALQTLAVVLLLVMVGAVGFVYAEMHRESILSRLTSTEPGELGLDFWIKFASAGVIPVFSLLAAQFPSINQFLFSWLEPALQAMK